MNRIITIDNINIINNNYNKYNKVNINIFKSKEIIIDRIWIFYTKKFNSNVKYIKIKIKSNYFSNENIKIDIKDFKDFENKCKIFKCNRKISINEFDIHKLNLDLEIKTSFYNENNKIIDISLIEFDKIKFESYYIQKL